MVTRRSFSGSKATEREADHSPPSSAEIKECVELYLHSPSTPSWLGALSKHRDNCTFYIYQFILCDISPLFPGYREKEYGNHFKNGGMVFIIRDQKFKCTF
jgi:hypothetical protein